MMQKEHLGRKPEQCYTDHYDWRTGWGVQHTGQAGIQPGTVRVIRRHGYGDRLGTMIFGLRSTAP